MRAFFSYYLFVFTIKSGRACFCDRHTAHYACPAVVLRFLYPAQVGFSSTTTRTRNSMDSVLHLAWLERSI